ncbi:pentapeptide repeat-containing protein [Tritonibacter mobilis]|uniref:Pentapeptide repeat protein n=1 Tax=Tritonibacter mobilis F1926 TaxID=1265309 RepID=A0A1B1A8T4_9RHOB|nr:pentapeptide repeat-containing protein [Tritonibacter mobilis]ANP42937.1 hypothetical protein K529_019425 [Tritonibacter mobilis F1926]
MKHPYKLPCRSKKSLGVVESRFLDWIGLERLPSFENAAWFGPIVGVCLGLLAMALVVAGVATLIQFLSIVLLNSSEHEAIRNIGLAVVAVLGAPFVVWRAAVAQKQADIGEQSHITDQINKAVSGLGVEKTADRIGRPIKIYVGESETITQLVDNPDTFEMKPRSIERARYWDQTSLNHPETGCEEFEGLHIVIETWQEERTEIEWQSTPLKLDDGAAIASYGDWTVFSETAPNIEVRVGAIYALERICQDSPRDHIRIMEILTAYIRENSPVANLSPTVEPIEPKSPRTDIQAALDVVGRRSAKLVALEHSKRFRLDLRRSDLSWANFANGCFDGAQLSGCRLEAANFRNASLRGARLQGALLNFADFFSADLCGALLDHATLGRSDPRRGSITQARELRGMSVAGADLSSVGHLRVSEVDAPTFGTKDTILAPALAEKFKANLDDIDQYVFIARGNIVEDEHDVLQRLKATAFYGWSPFTSDDLATNSLRSELWNALGLVGFPFRDE